MINIKKRYTIPGVSILLCLLIFLLIFFFNDAKKPENSEPALHAAVASAKDSIRYSSDLYYLKHPYLVKGDQFNDAAEYDSAIYYYREASEKFEREKQWDNYVWINSYIGRLYLYVAGKNFEDALPYLEKAFKKGKSNLSSHHPYLATTYYYFGLYYYNKKIIEKALVMHNKALEILAKHYDGDNIYSADVYDALGNVSASLLFDNVEAEKYYLRSIKIKEALPGEEKKAGLTAGYYNLARLTILNGDYEKAQSYCYDAIRNAEYIKSHKAYWIELLEGVLANIYTGQGMLEKAITRLKNLISINYENNGDKSYLSYYYTSLGDIFSRSAKYDSAIINYKKALVLTGNQTLFYNQEVQEANADCSLGLTYLYLKNYPTSLFHLTKCLNIRLKIYGKKHRETAIVYQAIGRVYQAKGLFDSALNYFQNGLMAFTKNSHDSSIHTIPFSVNINNNFTSFSLLKDKAFVLKELYNQDSADIRLLHTSLSCYRLVDTLMTTFRSDYDRETAKLVFSRDNNTIYEEAIDCAALLHQKTKEKKYEEWIFNFMDKRKSSLLLEALNDKELFDQAGISPPEQKTFRSLQQEATFLQSRLETESSKENAEESVLKILHTRINTTETKLNTFKDKLVKKYPFYASTQLKNDSLKLKDVQAYSKRNNTVILEYFWGDKAVYALGIYKDKIHLSKISRSNDLELFLDTLKAALAKGYVFATKEKDFTDFTKSSSFLYNSLVNPIITSLQIKEDNHKPNIIIIPDGSLSNIPFEALVTATANDNTVDYQRLNYLINRFVISYAYSARFLLKKDGGKSNNHNPVVLALGFSKDDNSNSRAGEINKLRNADTAELPGAARELRSISQYMKGKFYTGDDATEFIFKKEAPDYDILHLAVHGVADSRNAYHSKLIFKKGNDSVNDGNLYSYEVYNLPIKARLAVLSACESGIGKLNPGEGLYSMTRGFVYAGCQSVVMSYWRVNDYSTQSIMSAFYKQISAGEKINQSLRQSKLDYISKADRRSAHPSNWAAFVAIGNISPLVTSSIWSNPLMIPIVILLLLISGYLINRFYNRRRRQTKGRTTG